MLGTEGEESQESDSGEELEDFLKDPAKWDEEAETAPEVLKGVMGMKFMRDAENRQKRANAESIREVHELIGAGSDDDEISETNGTAILSENPGRKTFTPGDQVSSESLTCLI
jgi:U3 small nucleolar RNA-associated protein 14